MDTPLLLWLILAIFLFDECIAAAIVNVPVSEVDALKDMYLYLNGSHWEWRPVALYGNEWTFPVNPNSPVPNPCLARWQGITCSTSCISSTNFSLVPCAIVEITLDSYRLNGHLPPSIGNFTYLRQLHLQNNRMIGSLPSEIGKLIYLEDLDLDNNNFVSELPHIERLYNLTVLHLSENQFYGTLPENYGVLTSLLIVDLSNNNLTGTVPEAIAKLPNLSQLLLPFNLLSGTLSTYLFSAKYLSSLSLKGNKISGTIPSEIQNAGVLQKLELGNNHLTGPIPSYMVRCTALFVISLEKNSFTGTMLDIANLTNLVFVDMSQNYLYGTLPDIFGRLINLAEFSLYGNYFSHTLPSSMLMLSSLTSLLLQQNYFTGTPGNVFSGAIHQFLTTVDLADNGFSGTIPTQLFALHRINSLALVKNCFTGSLPANEICYSTELLTTLDLDGLSAGDHCRSRRQLLPYFPTYSTSFITGTLPACLFEHPGIRVLHLSGNGLMGSLPTAVTISRAMHNLSLSYNRLSGVVPTAFQTFPFKQLDLSYNKITGTCESMEALPLSSDEGQLGLNSTQLSLQVNRLSGPMPSNFKHAPHISVVTGNLFGCAAQSDMPVNDPGTPTSYCGSYLVNVSLYATAILFLFVFLLVMIYLLYDWDFRWGKCGKKDLLQENDDNGNSSNNNNRKGTSFRKVTATYSSATIVESEDSIGSRIIKCIQPVWDRLIAGCGVCWAPLLQFIEPVRAHWGQKSILRWLNVALQLCRDNPANLRETTILVSLLSEFRLLFLTIGFYVVGISLPVYLGIQVADNHEFSTHAYQYAWEPSIAFVEGETPALILLAVTFISSCLTLYFIFRIDSKELGFDSIQHIRAQRKYKASLLAYQFYKQQQQRLKDNEDEKKRESEMSRGTEFLRHSLSAMSWTNLSKMVVNKKVSMGPDDWAEFNNSTSEFNSQYKSKVYDHDVSVNSRFSMSIYNDNMSVNPSNYGGSSGFYNSTTNSSPNPESTAFFDRMSHYYDAKKLTRKAANKDYYARFLLYFVIPLVNCVVILTVNGVYLYVILTQNTTFAFLAQSFLLIIKLVWNVMILPTMLRSIPSQEPMFVRKLGLQMLMLIFNVGVAPVLASAVASSSCFLNVFIQNSPVTVYFSYAICYIYAADGLCVLHIRLPLSAAYDPPFMYSYQCSSAILQNYVPVFIEMYALLCVGFPLFIMILIKLIAASQSPNANPNFKKYMTIITSWSITPGILRPPEVMIVTNRKRRRSFSRMLSRLTDWSGRSVNLGNNDGDTSKSRGTRIASFSSVKSTFLFNNPLWFRGTESDTTSNSRKNENDTGDTPSEDGQSASNSISCSNNGCTAELSEDKAEEGNEGTSSARSSDIEAEEKNFGDIKDSIANAHSNNSIVTNITDGVGLGSSSSGNLSATRMLLSPGVIFSHLVTHLAVLLTFGAAYPPLGAIIVITVVVLTYLWQILVGRYLSKIDSFASHERALLLVNLENNCKGVSGRLFHRSKWLLLLLKAAFFAMFAFDMTAGVNKNVTDNKNSDLDDYQKWIWAPVVYISYPLLLWFLLEIYIRREDLFSYLTSPVFVNFFSPMQWYRFCCCWCGGRRNGEEEERRNIADTLSNHLRTGGGDGSGSSNNVELSATFHSTVR